MVEKDPKM